MCSPLAPVRRLPSEVLGLIFLNALHPSPCPYLTLSWKALLTIPSVCARWRNVAISTRTLWEHIDIDFDKGRLLERARTWLERAGDIPLYIHFLSLPDVGVKTRYATEIIMPMLRPHLASISSLTFSGVNTEVANTLFAQWAGRGTMSDQLKSLRLFHTLPYQTLRWATIFRGLADLQLVSLCEGCSPTQDQLMQMISSSPCLHTLRIRDIQMPGVVGGKHPAIALPNLRLLDIMRVDPVFVLLLLSLLSPGSLPLDLRLETRYAALVNGNITAFLKRSNVISLGLEHSFGARTSRGQVFPVGWVPHLAHVRILILCCKFRERATLDQMLTSIDGSIAARFSQLHTLVLIDSSFSGVVLDLIKRVVDAYSLSRIIILRQEYLLPEDENFQEVFDGMKDWLRQRVKKVVFEDEVVPGSHDVWDAYVQNLIFSVDV
ncbi:hypothetical protein FRC08_006350 [Ceratobasidium sp. 394]|nr:hypothetical protein FRC08_006350 [Ceratobasidium sp. 394]KAG9085160.1 hypothetical protein FS749_004644 [Ceratobasidium sp. UAMH 11750]